MTVNYNSTVASAKFCGFLKLLFRWKGSIYKLLWFDTLLYLILWYIINIIYRFAITDPQHKQVFQTISQYCSKSTDLIPISWLLGFFVSQVYSRWWSQWKSIPRPGRLGLFVTASIHGHNDACRLVRRTVMRYVSLGFVMTMMSISPPVKKRFPTLSDITTAGMMLENEQEILESMQIQYNKYFIPYAWAATLIMKARKMNIIRDDFAVATILTEINEYRAKLQTLLNYDWVSLPLVYTQVVTIAVYLYFVICLIGQQWLGPDKGSPPFPLFTILHFVFYMGWLKVAEALMSPFGDQDDDFEINGLIDSNLKVSYLMVDEMNDAMPELVKDHYWNQTEFEIPYTEAAIQYHKDPVLGSAEIAEIADSKHRLLMKSSKHNTVSGEDGSDSSSKRRHSVTRRRSSAAEALRRFGSNYLPRRKSGEPDHEKGEDDTAKT